MVTSMSDDLGVSVLCSEINGMEGYVLSRDELGSLLEVLNIFKFSVSQNLPWFLESVSKYMAITGFILARAERILREEERNLDKIASMKYNGHRQVGQLSKVKPPPSEALKNLVRGESEYIEQQRVVSRATYHRDILKELRHAVSAKLSEVSQISNNFRLETRLDSE